MAKIVRYSGNLQAFASAAPGTERTIFGDVAQANDLTSQINAEFLRGWGIVGPSDQPSLEDFNGAMYTHGQLLAYLHQAGVAEYDAAQEYFNGSITQLGSLLYVSLQNLNTGNPPASSPAFWREIASRTSSYAVDSGAANTLVASVTPAPASLASIIGAPIRVKVANLNTGAATLALNGFAATPIVNPVGSALVAGQLPATAIATVIYDGTNFQLQTVQTGFGPHTMLSFGVGTTPWVAPAGVYFVKVRAWGAGGTGASGNGSNQAGAGGGAGGYGEAWFPVTPGTSYSVVVGAAMTPPATPSTTGLPGGLSSFGVLLTANGGGGGAVFGGAGGVGGSVSGATFFVTGNAGSSGLTNVGGNGGSPFGSTAALGSTLFGNPGQGPGGAGSGALAASAGNSLAANGAVTLEF